MLLLKNEAKRSHQELLNLIGKAISPAQNEVKNLALELKKIAEGADGWLSQNPNSGLPGEVETNIPVLTVEELLKIYRPLYPGCREHKRCEPHHHVMHNADQAHSQYQIR